MSAMKTLFSDIEELLDQPWMSCQQIADRLNCPVSYVNDIVESRHRVVFGDLISIGDQ